MFSRCTATAARARCVEEQCHPGGHLWEDVARLQPFLTIYTPTYRRPRLLAMCEASVAAQTEPVEHVIVHDEIGIGIDGVYAAMPEHAHLAHGRYVMVLSDDNVLADQHFARDLRRLLEHEPLTDGARWPVVVFKGQIGETLQPLAWGREPELERIDLSCFAVEREVWQRHADAWGHRYEGDFDFIHRLWTLEYRFLWWDRLAFRALQISRGAPEQPSLASTHDTSPGAQGDA